MHRLVNWLQDPALAFAARISIYSIGLSALWGTMDTLLVQERVADVVSATYRDTVVGLITFIGIAVGAVTQPIAGHAGDRSPSPNRRRVPIACGSALALGFLALFWWAPGIYILFGGYLLLQLSSNVAQAAYQAMIPDLVRPQNRGLASGVKNALDLIGGGLGLGAAGVLLSLKGYGWTVALFIGLLLALTAVLEFLWAPPAPPPPRQQRAHNLRDLVNLQGLVEPFRLDFRADRFFALSMAVRFLFLLGIYPVQRFFLYYLQDQFGIQSASKGTAFFILGALSVSILGAAVAGPLSDHFGRRVTLRFGILIGAAGVVGIAFSRTLWTLAGSGVLLAIGLGAFQAVNWALLADFIPEARGARFYGLANIATSAASSGAGLFGPLIDWLGLRVPGYQYEITFLVAAFVAIISLIPLQSVPSGRPQAPTPHPP